MWLFFCHFCDLGIWNDTNTLQCEHIMLSIINPKTFKMWSTHPYKISSNPSRLSQNWPSWAFRLLKSTKFENPSWKVPRSPYSRNGFTDPAKLGKVMHIVILAVLTVKVLKFINLRWWRSPFSQKNWKTASLTDLHHHTLLSLSNKTANIIKQNWNQFLLVVKATAPKQQISKFYPQILSTEASFYIYDRPLTDINVIASVCALNLRIKFWYLLF